MRGVLVQVSQYFHSFNYFRDLTSTHLDLMSLESLSEESVSYSLNISLTSGPIMHINANLKDSGK